jgi:hypothetical protein
VPDASTSSLLQYLATVDWGKHIESIASAGVMAALVAAGYSYFRDRRQLMGKASYMAMRLAVTLEAHALACVEFCYINQSRELDRDPMVDTNWDIKLPELHEYPDDAEGWQAMKSNQASKILGFRNHCRSKQQSLYWTRDYSPEALEYQIIKSVTGLGIDAWYLANELRKKHDAPGDTAENACRVLVEVRERAEANEGVRLAAEKDSQKLAGLF